jgi:Right handed beta helix region
MRSLIVAGMLVWLLVPTTPASADTYVAEPWMDCSSAQGAGGFNSGGYDQAGNLYIACGAAPIRVYDSTGARLGDIAHGAGTVSDVAPTDDGEFLYLARGTAQPQRMSRQANGSYALDSLATWSLEKYPWTFGEIPGDMATPMGHSIEVDGLGNLYVADGGWTEHAPEGSWEQNHNTILRYRHDGDFVTRFGQRVPNSWALGDFHASLHGIAVTRDGDEVFAADALNNRIQVFVRQGDGSYQAQSAIGSSESNNPGRTAYCDQRMASPYGVALDGSGMIYVLNTTCDQLLTFTPAGEPVTQVEWDSDIRPHGFAVSKNGRRVYVQQSQQLIRRSDLEPEPGQGEPDPGPLAPCDRWASPAGSDAAVGTEAAPYRSVAHLIESLGVGETGCLFSGQLYEEPAGSFIVGESSGTESDPVTIRSTDPANPARIHGQAWLQEDADHVRFRDLRFIGSPGSMKSAMLIIGGADGVELHENEITFRNGICLNIGHLDHESVDFVLRRNRIHDCGQDVEPILTGADSGVHGVYLLNTADAVIASNWIYDNLNRGIQLYPDADGTEIVRNLLDGNGSNLSLSSESSEGHLSTGNEVRGNLITNSTLRALTDPDWPDADSAQVWGYGFGGPARGPNEGATHDNLVTGNCVFQANPAHNFGGWGYAETANVLADPGYANRAAKDFTPDPGGPCAGMGPEAVTGPDPDPDPDPGSGPGPAVRELHSRLERDPEGVGRSGHGQRPRLRLRVGPRPAVLAPGSAGRVRIVVSSRLARAGGVRVCMQSPPAVSGRGCVSVGGIGAGEKAVVWKRIGVPAGIEAGARYRLVVRATAPSANAATARLTLKVGRSS